MGRLTIPSKLVIAFTTLFLLILGQGWMAADRPKSAGEMAKVEGDLDNRRRTVEELEGKCRPLISPGEEHRGHADFMRACET